MSVDENDINNLSKELQKFRDNFSGMMEDTHKSRVTLEGIEKALKDQAAAERKSDDAKMDTEEPISYKGFDSDDMKKALEAHKSVVEGMKQQQEEADKEEEETKSTKNTEDMLRNQERTSAEQMKTNDYHPFLLQHLEPNSYKSELLGHMFYKHDVQNPLFFFYYRYVLGHIHLLYKLIQLYLAYP